MSLIKIKAKIASLPTSEGGRSKPFFTGYRPNHNFGSTEDISMHMGAIKILDKDKCNPGETVDAEVIFVDQGDIKNYIEVGRKWKIQEAFQLIAIGEIVEIIDSKLEINN